MVYSKPQNCRKHHWLINNKPEEAVQEEVSLDIYKEDKESLKIEIEELLRKEFSVEEIIVCEGNEEARINMTREIMDGYDHSNNIIIKNACLIHENQNYCINYRYLVLQKEEIVIIHVLYKTLEKALGDYQTKQTLIPNVLYTYDILKSNIDTSTYAIEMKAVYLEINEFKIGDLSKENFSQKDIEKYLPLYTDVKKENEDKAVYSRKCKKCEYRNYCKVPPMSIADLESTPNCWRVLDPIIEQNGSLDLSTLTEQQVEKLSPVQKARYYAWKNKDGIYINKEIIQSFIDIINKKGYVSFDFETYSSMKPFDNRYKNYSQIPFSFSADIVDMNNIMIEHGEYIVDYKEKNFDSIIKAMVKMIPVDLPIVVYFKEFEIGRLKELKELYPEYESIIQMWIDNVVDLYEVFSKGGYYDLKFNNSISIKNVYPVMCESNAYKNLNIQKGDMALAEYKSIFNSKKSSDKADQLIKDLMLYNSQDTHAQIEIIEKLKEIVK